ncbi:MAG: GntR family transcriptional regulator [Bacillota bacterium]
MRKMEFSKLYLRTKETILTMINDNLFPGNKLPSEDELAKDLGVSLTTVREALLVLTKDGIITKKHGIGSFVHRSALAAKMRIDIISDFIDLLEDGGYDVRLVQSGYRIEPASHEEAQNLQVNGGDELFTYERVFYANDIPAIWALNKIPTVYLQNQPSDKEVERTIYQFVRKYCREELVQSILEFNPRCATKPEKELFALDEGTPLLAWDEVFYNIADVPITFNRITFNPRLMKLKMLRKW